MIETPGQILSMDCATLFMASVAALSGLLLVHTLTRGRRALLRTLGVPRNERPSGPGVKK